MEFCVGKCFHLHQVNDSIDGLFETYWQVHWECSLAQTVVNTVERLVKVATRLVDFVNKTDTRRAIFVSLAPDRF